jgi:hypothetical protein
MLIYTPINLGNGTNTTEQVSENLSRRTGHRVKISRKYVKVPQISV